MIQATQISIHEFRGIRDLTLDLNDKNFAICGPNGTGKSGIVDAIEFALTGNISRLSGTGTGGLSVKEHGPHVDVRNKPEEARVSLTVHIPSIKQDVTIVRNVKTIKALKISPDTPEIRAILNKVALHPEFKLSRRELIRYVLAEPGKRSQEVQELLRLDEVESTRALLQKISNASARDLSTQIVAKDRASKGLMAALNITMLSKGTILEAANEKRAILGLPPLLDLEANTSIKDGLVSTAAKPTHMATVPKLVAKTDLEFAKTAIGRLSDAAYLQTISKASIHVAQLTADEKFLNNASKAQLIQSSLDSYDEQVCPVCDTPWTPVHFRKHLSEKLQHYADATEKRKEAEKALQPVITQMGEIKRALLVAAKYGSQLVPVVDCSDILTFITDIDAKVKSLTSLLPLEATITALTGASNSPANVSTVLTQLEAAVNALPDPNQQDAARDFLSVGQERLETYRDAALLLKKTERMAEVAKTVLETYGESTTRALNKIYKDVEESFSRLYRLVNHGDEDKFKAQLKPSMGKLSFDVDFYGRGFFPPGAYHSEGHQDGMGLCLYLALMNHLAGDAFIFAVLDDVLMSVDSGHRREVSRMLKQEFPKTQFVLTTHDEVWLKHMRSAGLIENKQFAHFRTWNVDSGPTEWHGKDVWQEIDDLMLKNDIRAAAALLRNYLEYFSKEVCQSLRASVEFKGDMQFTLGALLPNAIAKMKKVIKAGKAAAISWQKHEETAELNRREEIFNAAAQATQAEQWQLNALVHYNEWATLDKHDFVNVVNAFHDLEKLFICKKCNATMYVTPNFGEPESLTCACGDSYFTTQRKAV
ncbi:ATP-binding protein [Undibacterium baiyunense]|uniref:AAA family ATPase n=1 Tax=Undibacterium baiyunense TaxID=2828731 RepID=A0A941I2L8_9BURK|nr:ATP-binding protein [Undibacterium baiyunense]MBR7745144.1 AAA family ATPase [Undibacterium baiyunense]